MRRLLILTALLLVMSCHSSGTTIKKPLYEDPAGWRIHTAKSGEDVVYHYYTGILERMPEKVRAQLPANFGGVFEEMSMEGAWKYWALVLVIPEGITTYWNLESRVALLYYKDGELHETLSQQLFMIQRCDLKAVDLGETGSFSIPPPFDIFETPNNYPVLFARFTLDAIPDTLLACEVYGVLTR